MIPRVITKTLDEWTEHTVDGKRNEHTVDDRSNVIVSNGVCLKKPHNLTIPGPSIIIAVLFLVEFLKKFPLK